MLVSFFNLEWFEWDMINDETVPFPEDMPKVVHYLKPSIDVCPMMTTTIPTHNGQVLHRSQYRPLIQMK